jgi:hypothetical protein
MNGWGGRGCDDANEIRERGGERGKERHQSQTMMDRSIEHIFSVADLREDVNAGAWHNF